MLRRMKRAALLDRRLYKEVAEDDGSTVQAFLVVVLAAVATAIGSSGELTLAAFRGIPAWIVISFIGWVIWASITYFAGTKL